MPSASTAFAVAMPTTCFAELITGPPELPGLIGAENWIMGDCASSILRTALTTPVDLDDRGLVRVVLALQRHLAAAAVVVLLDDMPVGEQVGAAAAGRLADRERRTARVARRHPEDARQRRRGDRLGVERVAELLLDLGGPAVEPVEPGVVPVLRLDQHLLVG